METTRYHTDHSVLNILGLKKEETQLQPTGPPKHRQRRNRTLFSDQSVRRLELIFETNPYPDIGTREQIAAELNITESRIQVWFQNRRSRMRRNTGQTRKIQNVKTKQPMPAKPVPVSLEPLHQKQSAFYNPYMLGFPSLYQPHPLHTPYTDYRNFKNVLPTSIPWSPMEHPLKPSFIPETSSCSRKTSDVTCQPEVSSTTSTPIRKNECIQRELSEAETRQADVNKCRNSLKWESKCTAADDYFGTVIDLSAGSRS